MFPRSDFTLPSLHHTSAPPLLFSADAVDFYMRTSSHTALDSNMQQRQEVHKKEVRGEMRQARTRCDWGIHKEASERSLPIPALPTTARLELDLTFALRTTTTNKPLASSINIMLSLFEMADDSHSGPYRQSTVGSSSFFVQQNNSTAAHLYRKTQATAAAICAHREAYHAA